MEGIFDWVFVLLGLVLLEYLGILEQRQVTTFSKTSLSSSIIRRD